jgi:hypothetical protein
VGEGNKLKMLVIPLETESRGTEAMRETAAAYGIWNQDTAGYVWFPKSQVQEFVSSGDAVSFWCPEWLIEAKGVEAYIDTSYEPGLFE